MPRRKPFAAVFRDAADEDQRLKRLAESPRLPASAARHSEGIPTGRVRVTARAFVVGEELAAIGRRRPADRRTGRRSRRRQSAPSTSQHRHPDAIRQRRNRREEHGHRRGRDGSVRPDPLRRTVCRLRRPAVLRADPNRLRLPRPSGARHRAPLRHEHGLLRDEPSRARGPWHHADSSRTSRWSVPRTPTTCARCCAHRLTDRARCTSGSAAVATPRSIRNRRC